MKLTTYSKPFPECPHLKECGNHQCAFLSDAIGREVEVTSAFCNLVCDGGEKKQTLVETVEKNWLHTRLRGDFIHRVLDSYKLLRPIAIPKWWEDAKSELATILALPFVKSICLTGSAIYGDIEKPDKDVDLIINVTSFAEIPDGFRASLPKQVVGLKCDWFIQKHWTKIFPELDCENKTLTVPDTFPMEGRSVEQGVKVITVPGTAIPLKPQVSAITPKPAVQRPIKQYKSGERPSLKQKERGCGCGKKK